MGYPHNLLGANEHIEHELHPHWKELVFPAILVPVVVGVGTYLFVVVGDRANNAGRWATFGIALIILLFGFVIPYLRWRTTLYVLTNERIITREGILSRSGRDIPLSRVNDVSFSHNVIERILKCGKLTVESAGERGQLVLRDVPNVEQVQRELYRLVEGFTTRRGDSGPVDGGTGS
jgi:uncharacterized membrane protein YdbT with pleckstrin-like domain